MICSEHQHSKVGGGGGIGEVRGELKIVRIVVVKTRGIPDL